MRCSEANVIGSVVAFGTLHVDDDIVLLYRYSAAACGLVGVFAKWRMAKVDVVGE